MAVEVPARAGNKVVRVVGPRGPRGLQGATGATGATGPAGPPGPVAFGASPDQLVEPGNAVSDALAAKLNTETTVETGGATRSNALRWRDKGFKLVEAPGFVTGTGGSTSQRQARAVQNTLAADAWIAKWADELEQDHRRSTLILPDADYMMAALPRDNAHYVGSGGVGEAYEASGGRSSHCLFLNALGRPNLKYGTIECGNGRLVRDPNDATNFKPIATPDPGTDDSYDYDDEPTTGLNVYDSCLYIGGWKGLNIKGLFRCIGYREDWRRGAQSGSGIDVSYGAEDIYIEGVQAELGTNSVGAIGMNRRGSDYTVSVPTAGYDTTRPVKNVYIGSAFGIGGEHALQVFLQDGFHCDYLRIRKPAPFDYQGVQQEGYMQRGIYAVSGRASFGTIDLGPGPAHVAIFAGILQSYRNPADLHLNIGRLIAEALTDQDVDLHSLIGYYDQNDGVGAYRKLFLNIDYVQGRGYKRLFSTQDRGEAGGWFDETQSPIGMLRIGHIDAEVTSQGLSLRPYGGSGPVVLNTGKITVLPNADYSDATPVRGLEVNGLAETNRIIQRASPKTYAQLLALTPVNRQHAYVTDWPVEGGGTEAADVVYQAKGPGPDFATVNAWRKLNTPGLVESVDLGSVSVTSGNAPGYVAGARTVTTRGNRFTYVAAGVVGAETRCLRFDAIEAELPTSYWTSDGLVARQQYPKAGLPVTVPRFGYRDEVRVTGIGPIAAGGRTLLLSNWALAGVKFGDRVEVAPSANQSGLTFEGFYKSPGLVDVYVRNTTAGSITGPANCTYRVYYYGSGSTTSTV